jgi:hypothetical protein
MSDASKAYMDTISRMHDPMMQGLQVADSREREIAELEAWLKRKAN